MLIQLVGFMACGKSTLGPLLALSLSLPFKDLDHEVEMHAGKSVEALFQEVGEEGFRRLEREAYSRLTPGFHGVLALGGGLPCQPGMAQIIAATGLCLFLDVEEELLQARLQKVQRPLLKDLSARERASRVSRLLAQRRPYYQKAGRAVKLERDLDLPGQLDVLLDAVKRWSA